MLWIDIDPHNIQARISATQQLLKYKQYDKALDQLEALLDLTSSIRYDHLLRDTARADSKQRLAIIARLDSIIKKHPQNAQIRISKAILENISNLMSDAKVSVNQALAIEPNYTIAILLKSDLMLKLGNAKGSLNYLGTQSKALPTNEKLGLAYARGLAQRKDFPKLKEQLNELADNFPKNAIVLLSTAQIAQASALFDIAKSHLKQLIASGSRPIEAYFFLARIAQHENNLDDSILYLQEIKPGPGFSSAQIQIASIQHQQGRSSIALNTLHNAIKTAPSESTKFLLAQAELHTKDNQYQAAIGLLNGIIENNADSVNALYMRAMAYAELDRFKPMEADLRRVLSLEPENSAALNALGYTLADKNDRLEEASTLIEKAYTLSPNDPAIIDSLGWLKYRMGDNTKALELLKKAYALFKDQEIAAHLGELLWVTGNKEEAQLIWKQGLELTPNSEVIQKAIKHLTQ